MEKSEVKNMEASYFVRNMILREIGFRSYREYLKSDLWKIIKSLVFEKKGRKCSICGGKAACVHHHRYDEKTLLGASLVGLFPLCNQCHEEIEFEGNEKTDFKSVRTTFREKHITYCDRTGTFNIFGEEAKLVHKTQAMRRCACGKRPRFGSDLCRPCEKAAVQEAAI